MYESIFRRIIIISVALIERWMNAQLCGSKRPNKSYWKLFKKKPVTMNDYINKS